MNTKKRTKGTKTSIFSFNKVKHKGKKRIANILFLKNGWRKRQTDRDRRSEETETETKKRDRQTDRLIDRLTD